MSLKELVPTTPSAQTLDQRKYHPLAIDVWRKTHDPETGEFSTGETAESSYTRALHLAEQNFGTMATCEAVRDFSTSAIRQLTLDQAIENGKNLSPDIASRLLKYTEYDVALRDALLRGFADIPSLASLVVDGEVGSVELARHTHAGDWSQGHEYYDYVATQLVKIDGITSLKSTPTHSIKQFSKDVEGLVVVERKRKIATIGSGAVIAARLSYVLDATARDVPTEVTEEVATSYQHFQHPKPKEEGGEYNFSRKSDVLLTALDSHIRSDVAPAAKPAYIHPIQSGTFAYAPRCD